jgi:hypothetical protein
VTLCPHPDAISVHRRYLTAELAELAVCPKCGQVAFSRISADLEREHEDAQLRLEDVAA